jgi:hypothetical protein
MLGCSHTRPHRPVPEKTPRVPPGLGEVARGTTRGRPMEGKKARWCQHLAELYHQHLQLGRCAGVLVNVGSSGHRTWMTSLK